MHDVQREVGAALADRYTLEGEIGRGGMGIVFAARDLGHDRDVALKVLRPELATNLGAERFAREIAIAQGLSHPHILPVLDSGVAAGLPYLVMPLIHGETLGARLRRKQWLPTEEAVRIAADVAGALAHAHGAGIVHRDIKPDNILLTDAGAVVADFGIARALDLASNGRLTTSGVTIGTPSYMSPEQAYGLEVDGRSDVYSLACVTYEMLAGHPPYLGTSHREVISRHALDPVPPLASSRPDVPLGVQQTIERALAKTPVDRLDSAAAFARSLEDGLRMAPLAPSAPWRKHRAIAAAIVLALVLGVGSLLRGLWEARAPTAQGPALIAIFPFRVVGDSSVQYLGEGLIDLIATKLTAMDGPRAMETGTVVSAWRNLTRRNRSPTLADTRATATSLGSSLFVVGELVASPDRRLSVSARLFSAEGKELATVAEAGPADSLFALVDRLSVQLLARRAGEPGSRLVELTSTSPEAVRSYLAGRAAWRRGARDEAITHFSSALETDTTFALAALGMAGAGVWSQQAGQSVALRAGLRAGYRLRQRLSPRDRLLFEAYVTPPESMSVSSSSQLDRWHRAAVAAPENAEAQYEYGDRLYHTGAQLGIPEPVQGATLQFHRALSLDSAFAAPRAHLLEIGATKGAMDDIRHLEARYFRDAGGGEAADFVRWRIAVARGDAAGRAALRAQARSLSQTALNRIIGFGITDGVGLDDVDSAITELVRRIRERTVRGGRVHPAETLHSWGANRARPWAIREGIRVARSMEPVPPGSSIVYFNADQMLVLDALFWDGDSRDARPALDAIARRVARPVPTESGARAVYFSDACVLQLWHVMRQERPPDSALLDRMRRGVQPSDSAQVHGGSPTLCVMMLEALAAERNGTPNVALRVDTLERHLGNAPYQFGVAFGNLVLAQLYERAGNTSAALAALRRRPYDWDTGPLFLSTYLREEARLAAVMGDSVGAMRARRHYLALRTGGPAVARGAPSQRVVRQDD